MVMTAKTMAKSLPPRNVLDYDVYYNSPSVKVNPEDPLPKEAFKNFYVYTLKLADVVTQDPGDVSKHNSIYSVQRTLYNLQHKIKDCTHFHGSGPNAKTPEI